MMWALLSPRLLIAAILVGAMATTHFMAYRAGRAHVRAQWDADIVKREKQVIDLQQAARAREQQLVAAKNEAEVRYVQLKKQAAVAAAGAQSALDGLRNELAIAPSATCADPAAGARADAGTRLESDLLGHCAQALVGLAAEADRLEAQVVGLQGYVKQVCLRR
ncbi:MAG: DUF2514 family protein [Sphingomonadaceae bacterium]|nr:DUF2514 family protein [Sphingomonadaceae bacterium]